MKCVLITDNHIGARNDSQIFARYFKKFYETVFFPYLDKHNIRRVFMLGDTFDRRKYINFNSLHEGLSFVFDEFLKRNIKVDVLIGNHDIYYKNTLKVNSPQLLLSSYSNVTIHENPKEVQAGGTKILLMPWICPDNHNICLDAIAKTKAEVLFGHLEIPGFEMYRGIYNEHGLEGNIFGKFDTVASGHFHHKSTRGNINYLGAPYEITWSDYNDPRGFHLFDTGTHELEFIKNPYSMFHKVYYDDRDKTIEEILNIDFEQYRESYVKVIIKNKDNPFWFDKFIDGFGEVDVAHIQVVEDHLWLDLEDEEDIINEAEDTLTILSGYVQSLEAPGVDKKAVDNLLRLLYNEAVTIQ